MKSLLIGVRVIAAFFCLSASTFATTDRLLGVALDILVEAPEIRHQLQAVLGNDYAAFAASERERGAPVALRSGGGLFEAWRPGEQFVASSAFIVGANGYISAAYFTPDMERVRHYSNDPYYTQHAHPALRAWMASRGYVHGSMEGNPSPVVVFPFAGQWWPERPEDDSEQSFQSPRSCVPGSKGLANRVRSHRSRLRLPCGSEPCSRVL
jgi:hypothetical protein